MLNDDQIEYFNKIMFLTLNRKNFNKIMLLNAKHSSKQYFDDFLYNNSSHSTKDIEVKEFAEKFLRNKDKSDNFHKELEIFLEYIETKRFLFTKRKWILFQKILLKNLFNLNNLRERIEKVCDLFDIAIPDTKIPFSVFIHLTNSFYEQRKIRNLEERINFFFEIYNYICGKKNWSRTIVKFQEEQRKFFQEPNKRFLKKRKRQQYNEKKINEEDFLLSSDLNIKRENNSERFEEKFENNLRKIYFQILKEIKELKINEDKICQFIDYGKRLRYLS